MERSNVCRLIAMGRAIGIVAATATALAIPADPACAQLAPLERAELAADEGSFEQALTHLNRAIRSDDLSRVEMLEALERRVLVYYALRRAKPMERDLELLLAIDPTADFGASAPPDLAAVVAERRQHAQALRVSARVRDLPGAVRVQAHDLFVLEGYGLRALVGARSPGGAWQLSYDGQVDHASPGPTIEYFATLVTADGAVLVSDGTQEAPNLHRVPSLPVSATTTHHLDARPDGRTGDRRRTLWWTVGGSSVMVAVATTIAVFLARGTARSGANIQGPSVEYP